MLKTCECICDLFSEARWFLKMQSYLWKLHVTNHINTSIRDWRFDARCLNKFFAAYKRYRTTSAKQAWSKRYVRGKRVKNRRWIVSCLFLYPFASFLTFFPILFLCSKTKTTHQTAEATHQVISKWPVYFFPLLLSHFFVSKPRHYPLENSFWQNLPISPLFLLVV